MRRQAGRPLPHLKAVAIIQARLGSSRLPAKVLLPLPTGRSVIAEVAHRVSRIRGIDEVVVAIPDDNGNDLLAKHVEPLPVRLYRGSEEDVLARYYGAATAVDAKIIMRITADCPLIDPPSCAGVLATYRRSGMPYDYVSNTVPRTFPKGLDCEVFSYELLKYTHDQAVASSYREHVTLWMLEGWNRPNIRVGNFRNQEDYSDQNWSLDTLSDYIRICDLFQHEEVRVE